MEQPAARQARLDRQRVCRAAEQPAARQTSLAIDHQCTHERRGVEQPEPRQARLERLHERNRQQRAAEQAEARQARLARNWEASRRRRQAERQSEPQQTSMPALEDEWVQGKLAAFHAKISSLSYCHCSYGRHRLCLQVWLFESVSLRQCLVTTWNKKAYSHRNERLSANQSAAKVAANSQQNSESQWQTLECTSQITPSAPRILQRF